MAVGIGVMAVCWGLPLLLYFFVGMEEEWVLGIGVVGLALAALAMAAIPINRCRCPTCGRRLSRPAAASEFACEQCRVVWTTRSYGGTIWG
jgi:hypothetical protein